MPVDSSLSIRRTVAESQTHGSRTMAKRKRKNPFPWLSSFNERKFEPFIRAIGQSTLLWNDLHEWLGFLYCSAAGGGFIDVHLRVWNAVANDRAKRDMLLAAAQWTFRDGRPFPSELDKKSYDAIHWLWIEAGKLENDRNNAIHAPLWKSRISNEVYPASAFGNQRARNLDDKYLLKDVLHLGPQPVLSKINTSIKIIDEGHHDALHHHVLPRVHSQTRALRSRLGCAAGRARAVCRERGCRRPRRRSRFRLRARCTTS